MKNFLILLFLAIGMTAHTQVSINIDGTLPDNSAMLDVKSTAKGLLIPRMTQAQRNAISSPATGLMIWQTDNSPGFYYNSGTNVSPVWVIAGTGSGWGLTGNSGTSAAFNFIGTTDNIPLVFRVNNQQGGRIDPTSYNTSIGYQSLSSVTTGTGNTTAGFQSLFSNTSGIYNFASGYQALYSNTTGSYNISNGYLSLFYNSVGNNNTANGASSMFQNISGSGNTANGYMALYGNFTGNNNTAIGKDASHFNSSGNSNTRSWQRGFV